MKYDEFSALSVPGRPREAAVVSPSSSVRSSVYGEWIAGRGAPWQLFVTLTVKDMPDYVVGVSGSERFLKSWFRDSVRSRGFARGTKPYGFFALEKHKDRVPPHFHGLLGGLPDSVVTDTVVGQVTRGEQGGHLWREWYRDHGRARIEPVRGLVGDEHAASGVARYTAKYMTKDSGKFYALGSWPQVSEYDDSPDTGDESESAWDVFPGSENARRVWREMCEGEAVKW